MLFEWDEPKNQANQQKHGLSFEEAALVFEGPVLTRIDRRTDYGEVRKISTGMTLPASSPHDWQTEKRGGHMMSTVRKSLSDLSISKERLKELSERSDKSIDYSDIPPLHVDFFEHAELVYPPGEKSVTIRLDADVLAWMKAQGQGYQSRINAILRAYYEAHRHD